MMNTKALSIECFQPKLTVSDACTALESQDQPTGNIRLRDLGEI